MVKGSESIDFSNYEAASLRKELGLRILLQNILLIVSVWLFSIVGLAAAIVPRAAWALAAIENVAILAAVLQWCHHGVRTAQIKKYLLLIAVDENGWEHWLPMNRPVSFLGSRWMVSTKGVFLGLGLAGMAIAVLVSPQVVLWPTVVSVALWVASSLFLFTNPKE